MRIRRAVLLSLVAAALASTGLSHAAAHHVQDVDEIPWGCPAADCIPAIEEPTFGDGDWLSPDDRVLGIVVGPEARAYPTRILDWHEIVNDEIAGEPVVVTYCPLCGTGLAFEREVAGETTTFGVSGRLYHNDLVMYDRATESLWSQVLGEAIWGERHGDRLTPLRVTTTTWEEWRATHPRSVALERPDVYDESRYDVYPYGNYESDPKTLFPTETTTYSLHPKEWVLGVFTENETVAFLVNDVERHRILHDRVDGRALVAIESSGAPHAYWAGEREFRFDGPRLVDERGRSWDPATGEGPDGERLESPWQVTGFWFGWNDFHPTTRVYGRLLVSVSPPSAESGTTVRFSEPVDWDMIGRAVGDGVRVEPLDARSARIVGSGVAEAVLPAGAYGQAGGRLHNDVTISLSPNSIVDRTLDNPRLVVVLGAAAAVTLLAAAWAARRWGRD